MVSEWEKLKTDMDKITADLSDIGFVIEWAKLWVPIEKFVDDLVAKNHIQDEQLLQQSLEMEEKEDLLQLANGRCNELARELGEARAENQQLREKLERWEKVSRVAKMLSPEFSLKIDYVVELEERLKAVRELVDLYNPKNMKRDGRKSLYLALLEVLGSG